MKGGLPRRKHREKIQHSSNEVLKRLETKKGGKVNTGAHFFVVT